MRRFSPTSHRYLLSCAGFAAIRLRVLMARLSLLPRRPCWPARSFAKCAILCHYYSGGTSIMAITTGDNVRTARITRAISQAELARRAGISRQALGAIESGVYLPSVAVALSLARELGENVESLFGGDSEANCRSVAAHLSANDSARSATASSAVILGRVAGK